MYEYHLTVRGYELDSFRHVNNAVYLSYYEQARWEILKEKNLFPYFEKNNLFLAVTEANIRYIREVYLFDELVIKTTIETEPPYLVFHQAITNKKSGQSVSKAKIKTLLVDHERIPHDIPDELLKN